jgi:uncharacterized protein involved in exopolysaccharide biosynthesis
MVASNPNQQERDPAADDDEGGGVDVERVKEMGGFVLRAARRRPILAATVFTGVAAVGVAMAVTMPRTYGAQVKLLAEANLVVPALSNPGRTVPRDADSPTKNVADEILRRDNLNALAKETNLVERYYAARSPVLKLKDRILGGPATPEDKLAVVVATLEKNVTVTVLENNVTIGVDWYDAQSSYDLVTTVQKNFQSARYDDDVAMISDAINVLQEHAKTEADEVDAALAEYQKVTAAPPATVATPTAHAPPSRVAVWRRAPRPPSGSASASPAAAPIDRDLAAALEDKRQQIRSLEAERQRELDVLRAQLAQSQLTLTPQHPTVIALQQKIDALSAPDAQLAQLKADERALMASIAPPVAPLSGTSPSVSAHALSPFAPAPATADSEFEALPASPPPPAEDGPRAQLARSKLEGAIHRYQDAVTRIDGANMELEIARTAYKYRYTVVTPAELPRKPKKPVATLVGVASVIGAALAALLMATGADLLSGRILEEWQVRRRLKLEVLGEVDSSAPVPWGPV